MSTGVWGALSVALALLRKKATGEGAHLEIALADVCLYMQMAQLAMHVADPAVVRRSGNHSMVSCTPMMPAADGRLMLTILHDRHWHLLCDLTSADAALRGDPRFAGAAARTVHQGELEAALGPRFRERTRAEWLAVLGAAGMPCAPERGYDEVVADEHLYKSGILQRQGASLQLGLPFLLEGERVGSSDRSAARTGAGRVQTAERLSERARREAYGLSGPLPAAPPRCRRARRAAGAPGRRRRHRRSRGRAGWCRQAARACSGSVTASAYSTRSSTPDVSPSSFWKYSIGRLRTRAW